MSFFVIVRSADSIVTVILNGAMGLVFIITYVSLQLNVAPYARSNVM